jgi:putative sigma-54 modulation protein
MLWNLHTRDVELDAELKDHLERRLLFALSRFDPKILKVDVYVVDHNGPKGGIDKSCQIVVRLRGLSDVVVKTADADWTVCIDRSTTRIGQHVRRALARKREHQSRPV